MRLNPGQVYSVHKQCELTFGGSYQFCPSPIKGEGECVRLWCTNSKRKHGCRTLHMPWADGTLCGRKSQCPPGTPDFREMQCAAYNNKLKLQGLPPNVRWLPKYAGSYNYVGIIPKGAQNINIQQRGYRNLKDDDTFLVGELNKKSVHQDVVKCSHTCGSGIRHRKVYCYLGDSKVDESRCSILMKPVATESCNHGTCPFWYTGYWEGCSVTCGKGFQTRQVRCQDKHGRHTINSRCSGSPKPSERQTCRVEKCGVWREGPWGECSVTCGEGRVTRQIACFLFDRHRAEERACDPEIRPVGTKPCYAGDCLTTRYYFETTTRVKVISESRNIGTDYWRVGPWSGCSATCEGGWQRRQVVCQDDFYRETNRCNNLTKPEVLRSCDAGPCPGWTTGMWSECSRSCGGDGIQSRRVLCQMVNGRVLPDRMCDITVRPVDRKLCNNGTCHTSRRRWHVPAWSPVRHYPFWRNRHPYYNRNPYNYRYPYYRWY
ncbi:hypothetical protein KUTeg_020204 [Tegillarca granosa]|uniref:ADAMTS cysteine-rich domain-containing protein n=1 Tax=Tegillarca granosa TaxID=220873 RepID=A0ABQ9EBF1_TEGGR|nr:hypothetical protein KUTeg_020204 [Tegillarca granosa]